jgi:two-component system, NtrC family, sensor kinase
MATLYLLGEEGTVVQRWEIGDQPVTIGRDDTADLTIQDDTLSRHHFMIWREGEHYLIKDLNSQNGTLVDGLRAQGNTLKHNDCIVAGRTLFIFHRHPLPGPAGLPPAHDAPILPAALAAKGAAQPTSHNLSQE